MPGRYRRRWTTSPSVPRHAVLAAVMAHGHDGTTLARLTADLGVSRAVIVEAVHDLAGLGLVTVEQLRGVRLAFPTALFLLTTNAHPERVGVAMRPVTEASEANKKRSRVG